MKILNFLTSCGRESFLHKNSFAAMIICFVVVADEMFLLNTQKSNKKKAQQRLKTNTALSDQEISYEFGNY